MAVVMGERLLVLVFVTSLLVWAPASGEGASDEEAPGTVAHVQETVEKREVLVESKAEEETEQLPTASSEQTENSNHEEITKGEGEVTEEHDVVMSTHHPGDLEPLIEPPLATPPGDETTPTNLEVTPTVPETDAELEQPIEIVSSETEATPTGEGGEEREGGGEEGDDVPTFTEFSQRKRMEQNSTQRLTNEKLTLTNGGQHNYASIDCGAKIIASNKETQNPSAILSENRDHYMINPCSADIWFVVELCELVELHSLQIACFELFSSIPENFNISVSERYPVDEWRFLGMLHASNEREVQTFLLSPDESSYAKFLRVDMVSHYGSEHFCPLSLLRVNGSSMMEVYEYSESQQEGSVESLSPTVAPYEGDREEDDLFGGILEENVSQQLEAGIQGVGAGLKELLAGAVRGFIETVGDYMRPAEDKDSHTPPEIVTPGYLTPESDVEWTGERRVSWEGSALDLGLGEGPLITPSSPAALL
ncbi:SUN domain-containing ossification factor [Geodia barretti]|uniref:SUN domain-containing ossification factor n=1 Tax=Geodia barretti TaxID=519541 RepID=A0AA35RDG4_GEOBA|nr:SUN domain-containing ossification factor [Geodia barretti]